MSDTDDQSSNDARRAALEALGIDPDTVVFPSRDTSPTEPPEQERDVERPLTDEEWALIEPFLPNEPAQALAITNRAFVDTVLWVFARAKHWTQIPDDRGEATRKRFTRWAHAGVWQRLAADIKGRGLGPVREGQLQGLAARAHRLHAKVLAARARR